MGNLPSDGEGLYKREEYFSCVSDSYDYVGKSPELLNTQEIQREGVGLRDFKTPQGSRYEISASGDSPSAQFAATPCGPAPELGEQLSRAPADLSASVNGVFAIPRDLSLHGRGNKSGALCFDLSCGSGNGISKTRNNELQDVGRGLKRDALSVPHFVDLPGSKKQKQIRDSMDVQEIQQDESFPKRFKVSDGSE